MTNWKRVFEHIWMQIRWLNSYGHMNEIALRKILKKFCKNFFVNKETPVKKKLLDILATKNFEPVEGKMNEELLILSADVLKFYADCFCNGNLESARAQIDEKENEMRRTDHLLIYLFLGMIVMLIPNLIFAFSAPE